MDLPTLTRVLKEVSPEVMEALNPETLRALAQVPPDVLHALKDVSPEVMEALQPEVLAALPGVSSDQLQALRHVPPEVVENLSPELLSSLAHATPDLLQALHHVPSEVVENLSPELLHALAGVRPEVLLALKEVPAEVVESLRPELLEALSRLPVDTPVPPRPPAAGPRDGRTEASETIKELLNRIPETVEAALNEGISSIGYFGGVMSEDQPYVWMNAFQDSGGGSVTRILASPDYKVAQVLSVLGSEVRLSILRRLLQGPRSAAELVDELRLGTTGQAYHHLRELEGAGYIEQRNGRYQFIDRSKRAYLTALAIASDFGAATPDQETT